MDTMLPMLVTLAFTLPVAAAGAVAWWWLARRARAEMELSDAQRAVRAARRASQALKRGGGRG